MDSYTERASSPGTERILIDFYNTDDDTTNTSITSNRRREKQKTHLNHMARRDPPQPPLRNELVSEKINDKHYASDMIRRTVFTNQNQSNSKDPQNDYNHNNATSSESEIAARTSNRQMKGLQHSQSMQTIIQQVMEVHNSVTGALQSAFLSCIYSLFCYLYSCPLSLHDQLSSL